MRAYEGAEVRETVKVHLRHEPLKESKSRIKRLRGMVQPQSAIMKHVDLAETGKKLSRILRESNGEELVIVSGKRPIGCVHSFADDEEWYEYRLLNDPRFIRRI